jgi:hypothetical protein
MRLKEFKEFKDADEPAELSFSSEIHEWRSKSYIQRF